MILLDEPRWPAHGRHFAHLVSDASLAELFAFAAEAGLHPRAFDHDHYDVADSRLADLVALGAEQVASTDLLRRLRASGLRVRPGARTPTRAKAREALATAWAALLPGHAALGEELLRRWSEGHRHYHDVRHLLQALTALDALGLPHGRGRAVRLAAWFHDAVYEGAPGTDEHASAALALDLLPDAIGPAEAHEVARLVAVTASHDPDPEDAAGAALCDADLSILGQAPGRYFVYARDVRLDYADVGDADFLAGRRRVLDDLASRPNLFRTPAGRVAWADAARRNLDAERELLASGLGAFATDAARR